MTPQGIDRQTVTAATKADAIDKARRRWKAEGLRMVQVIDVQLVRGAWRVEATVEVMRK